ncbi:SERTA domain-containing protein 2 isoform X4 [Callithrix jacchus]|uniref:E3 ubiquitin-protein ligase ZNF598-like n=1 Tax=Callithrix jacchus TaxID=9483 RepID=UPI0023DD08BC|nr:E3 ubiquitin-protein ligase ZNF598-like [Callithrix jacchus]
MRRPSLPPTASSLLRSRRTAPPDFPRSRLQERALRDLIHSKSGCPPGVEFDRWGSPAALGRGVAAAAAACTLSKEPASAAASSCRLGVGSTARAYRCHAASSGPPLPPRGPGPHTVICVTDPSRAGGEGGPGEALAGRGRPGPPAPSTLAGCGSSLFPIGHTLASITPARRFDWQKAHFWRRRPSDSAALRRLLLPSTPHFNVHPPLPTPYSAAPAPLAAVSLEDSLGQGRSQPLNEPRRHRSRSTPVGTAGLTIGSLRSAPAPSVPHPPVAASLPGSLSALLPRPSPPHLPSPAGRGLLYDSVKSPRRPLPRCHPDPSRSWTGCRLRGRGGITTQSFKFLSHWTKWSM